MKLLQHIMCISFKKYWINRNMETGHYKPHSNPVQYN
ncbi:hypothetical protein E2C01_051884 [Portunus trituberculatus]|uniref:Uncharacterized protein n=1 Tax=Portunus trituberculatus TaxID=210409 RepID=A0A5B7GMX1_PORTR|nr:hypothetical protein [Portunus trituberculatus]